MTHWRNYEVIVEIILIVPMFRNLNNYEIMFCCCTDIHTPYGNFYLSC